jgi:PAS domain S-box-containing protein
VVRDITRRRQIEWELARLASFPQLDPKPIFECDAEGSVTYANPAALRLLQSLGGPEPAARLLPQNLPALVRGCLAGCDDHCRAETVVDARTLLWLLYPLPETQRVRAYAVDITARKQAEEALRESEERFRLLVEALPVAVRVVQDGRLRFINSAGAALYGYGRPEELLDADSSSQVSEEDRARLGEYMQKRAAGEEAPTRYEFRARRRDGSLFPAEAAVARIIYREQVASLTVIRDLTEGKRLRLFESLLPVCCLCGKVRDDTKTKRGHGSWRALEEYVVEHSDADLTHTFCPNCYRTYREREGLPPAEPPEG